MVEGGIERVRRCQICRRVEVSGLPVRFADVTLASVRPKSGNRTAIERAQAVLSTPRDLFLTGPVGTGKTMLVCSVGREFTKSTGREALFVWWPKALHQLQPGRLSDDDCRRLENKLCTVPLLIIDDVGAERDQASDFTRRMTLFVYEARGHAGLQTLFTSNLTLDDLGATPR